MELPDGYVLDMPFQMDGFNIVALNVTKLCSDNVDPRKYKERCVEAGGGWRVINDMDRRAHHQRLDDGPQSQSPVCITRGFLFAICRSAVGRRPGTADNTDTGKPNACMAPPRVVDNRAAGSNDDHHRPSCGSTSRSARLMGKTGTRAEPIHWPVRPKSESAGQGV